MLGMLLATTSLGQVAKTAQKVLTDQEVADYAAAVEKAATTSDATGLTGLVDWPALLEKATADYKATEKSRKVFIDAVIKSIDTNQALAKSIINNAAKGGSFRFLRARMKEGQKTALFRLGQAGGGISYFEFLLARRPDGSVKATNLYSFFDGELMSQTFRRLYLLAVASEIKTDGAGQEFAENGPKIKQMGDLALAGQQREALAILDSLPKSIQNEKSFLLARVKFTQRLDDTLYLEAMQRYQSKFPNDPSVDLISIDGLLSHRKFDEALAALERLDKSVGGDPFLDISRAGILLQADRLEKGREAAKRVVKAMPEIIEGYWMLIEAELALKDYPGVLAALENIDQHFQIKFNDISAVPSYAGFAKSPQYELWKKYLQSKAEKTTKKAG
jgi:hypothetical protein